MSRTPFRTSFAPLLLAIAALAPACSSGSPADPAPSPDAQIPPERVDAGADVGETSPTDGSTSTASDATPDGPSTSCVDTWASYAASFFAANCTRCHADFAYYKTVSQKQSAIEGKIRANLMPKDGPLAADDKARILEWLACGAKP